MRGKRPAAENEWSRFQIELRIVPIFVKDRRVFSDKSFEGESIYQATIQIGVSDAETDGTRRVEWSWNALGRQVETANLTTGSNQIRRIPLPLGNSPFRSGELMFEVSPW
jgi:hypothetical protein